jgi:hypothetical protein
MRQGGLGLWWVKAGLSGAEGQAQGVEWGRRGGLRAGNAANTGRRRIKRLGYCFSFCGSLLVSMSTYCQKSVQNSGRR